MVSALFSATSVVKGLWNTADVVSALCSAASVVKGL